MTLQDQLDHLRGKFVILEQFSLASALQGNALQAEDQPGAADALLVHLDDLDKQYPDVACPRELGMKEEIQRLRQTLAAYRAQDPFFPEEAGSLLSRLE